MVLEILWKEVRLNAKILAIWQSNLRDQMNTIQLNQRRSGRIEDWLCYQSDLEQLDIEWNRIRGVTQKNVARLKFLKGIEIIKLLYEKTLTLDHHFTSVATFNDINRLSNPNHYKEFVDLQNQLQPQRKKNLGFDLSPLLGSNLYTSVIYSMVSLFTQNSGKDNKQKRLQAIECILDFTLRMHQDLNTIYFETSFLQAGNRNIMGDLEQLFSDFVEPIEYGKSLKECRTLDDWDELRNFLGEYLDEATSNFKKEPGSENYEMWIDIDFPIHQLIQFIGHYNVFIDQGDRFYQKFDLMLDSYENKETCADRLPIEFGLLREHVQVTIKKFKTAYKPVEINGSRIKAILYGINEYE